MFYNQLIPVSKRYIQSTGKWDTERKYGKSLHGIILFSLLIISLKKFILGTELVCTFELRLSKNLPAARKWDFPLQFI